MIESILIDSSIGIVALYAAIQAVLLYCYGLKYGILVGIGVVMYFLVFEMLIWLYPAGQFALALIEIVVFILFLLFGWSEMSKKINNRIQ